MMLVTMLVHLNRPPQWFANLLVFGLYIALFGYIVYNIIQGFRMGKKRVHKHE